MCSTPSRDTLFPKYCCQSSDRTTVRPDSLALSYLERTDDRTSSSTGFLQIAATSACLIHCWPSLFRPKHEVWLHGDGLCGHFACTGSAGDRMVRAHHEEFHFLTTDQLSCFHLTNNGGPGKDVDQLGILQHVQTVYR